MARIRKSAPSREAAPGPLWRVALYIRLSRDDGNDESLSVGNQRDILTEFLARGFVGEYALAGHYVDDGRSGTDADRPAFQRMIGDIEAGAVNCVVCKNLARAFRNYADQGYFLESFFPLHGTRFIALGEPKVDTFLAPEAVSGLEVPINGLMNDRFAYATSSSVRRTFDTKRRAGEFIGAFAPYGYAKNPRDKNALVIDDSAAAVVRDIFGWFAGGMSKEGIARRLNALGIPNPTLYKAQSGHRYRNPHARHNDGLWTGASVSRVLRNAVYTGTMVQGRQRVISYKVHGAVSVPEDAWIRVPGTHEAVVSPELFARAQALHARDTRAAPGEGEVYLFSGLLRCADCGKSMTRRAAGGRVYYNCSTYRRKSKARCTKHTARLDVLERTVLAVIQAQIALAQGLDAAAQKVSEARAAQGASARLHERLKLRERERARLGELFAGLYLDWKNGDLTREQYRALKERLERQEAQLGEAVRGIRTEIEAARGDAPAEHPELQMFLRHRNIGRLSQGLLCELVEAILVHEGGGITVRFKTEDPYTAAPGAMCGPRREGPKNSPRPDGGLARLIGTESSPDAAPLF